MKKVFLGGVLAAAAAMLAPGCGREEPAAPVAAGPGAAAPGGPVKEPEPREHVRLILSGGLVAEIEPCGCRTPKRGGLTRRATAMAQAAAEVPGSIVVEFGDSLVTEDSSYLARAPKQARRKAEVVADFYKALNPAAFGLGEIDFRIGAQAAFDVLQARGITPLITNVTSTGPRFHSTRVADAGGTRFLVLNFIGREEFDKAGLAALGFGFVEPAEAMEAAVLSEPADFVVLSIHASKTEPFVPVVERTDVPLIIVDSCDRFRVKASVSPRRVVAIVPEKGVDLVTLDLFLRKGATEFFDGRAMEETRKRADTALERAAKASDPVAAGKYREEAASLNDALRMLLAAHDAQHLVVVRETLLAMKIAEDPATAALIREYEAWVKTKGAPEARPGDKLVYTGAAACAECHKTQHANWLTTFHSHAWESLEKDEHGGASNPECLSCHVSGFGDPGGPQTLDQIAPFKSVQCESCHTPQGPHPGGKPFPKITEATCTRCHTPSRDPRFKFDAYLPLGTCTQPLPPGKNRVPR